MNEQSVMALVAEVLGSVPLVAKHMTFGHSSITYDVALPERHVIVRTHANPAVFAYTEQNINALAQLGLPVPELIASDLTMARYPFAYMIFKKIAGRDLRYELSSMTHAQMTQLATQIVAFQRKVIALPAGSGYGYVALGGHGPYQSWYQLIEDTVTRPLSVVRQGPLGEKVPDPWQKIARFETYLRHVPPTCFLDDLTIKNVLVQDGELQGIVDFDCVCYGDPLFTISLTQTGIVSDVGEHGLFYIEELCRLWNVTEQQRQIINFYSAIHTIDFLQFDFEDTGESHTGWMNRMLQALQRWLDV
ncbi:phosphotransferase family protein [Dictyobacter kobayashii]|uniref:Aminoglycoside phosphotransferase domain-containing protein n=1 Tax=Dictyobacter kobayashii TaxID=2014872 RepID=A0A402AWH6_9CHLR|nr:aminoglycoside phosphotransferase family protein [Dictyobacter kobayashii]GCE23500.1 hypothetical protein KDK_73000 [Dictyobacter kobayashii]